MRYVLLFAALAPHLCLVYFHSPLVCHWPRSGVLVVKCTLTTYFRHLNTLLCSYYASKLTSSLYHDNHVNYVKSNRYSKSCTRLTLSSSLLNVFVRLWICILVCLNVYIFLNVFYALYTAREWVLIIIWKEITIYMNILYSLCKYFLH